MARTVNIALVPTGAHKVEFYPDLASLGDDTLLLEKRYSVTTAVDGTGSISLPTKVSGTIRWLCKLPKTLGSTEVYFYLGPGSTINLEDAIAAGTGPTDTLTDYVDSKISDEAYNATTWNGVTGVAPSKNAVRDAFEALSVGGLPDGDKGDIVVSGTGLVWDIKDEIIEDIIGTKVVAGSNVTVTYNDTTGETTIASTGGGGAGTVDTANSPNANEFARFTDADTIEGRTVAETKSDLSLGNVDNTSDANKPISTATQAALDVKQPLDSDLTTIAGLTATTDSFLQAKSSAWAARTIAQVKTDLGLSGTNSGDQDLSPYFHKTNDDTDDITVGATNKFATAAEKTKLGHITVTQAVDLDTMESGIALKANDADVVHDTGDETVAGVKTFSSSPIVPTPTTDFQASTKKYVDDAIVAGGGYTDEQAQDAVGGMVDATLAYVDATPLLKVADGGINTTQLANDAVTYAKIQNVSATDKLLGRSTSGAGDVEEIACTAAGRAILDDADAAAQRTTMGAVGLTGDETVAGVKTFSSDPLIPDEIYGVGWNGSLEPPTKNAVYDKIETLGAGVSDGDKGDVTVSSSGTVWTIDNDAVTYAKMQNVSATSRVLGRITSGAGDTEELTAANVRTIINVEDGADVTDAANVDAAGATMNADTSLAGNGYFLDEDDMSSDSATKVPSQQSVKAYVDAQTDIVVQTETGTTKTLAAADDTKETRYTNAGTKTLTLAATATVGTGHVSKHTNLGAGALTIAAGGMTVRNNLSTIPQYGSALVVAIGSDEFLIIPSITDSASARIWMGVEIGADVQAWSANLDEYAAVNPTAAGLALLDDAAASDQRTTLGLGTIATQNSNNVTITGGAVSGITDLALADGGTGASTAAGARTNIGVDTLVLIWVIDGGGSAISTGVKGYLRVPYACTITGWRLLADQSGSIVIDVWKDTYANYPPTVADTIAGSEKPTLSSVIKNEDTSLSTWTTSVSAGDILGFNVDSAATVTRVTLEILATRT